MSSHPDELHGRPFLVDERWISAAISIEHARQDDYVVDVTAVMYRSGMKAITITIPDELDAEAAAEAKRLGISKSELIRRGLTTLLPDHDLETAGDPWRRLAGFASEVAISEPGEIDRVVYDS